MSPVVTTSRVRIEVNLRMSPPPDVSVSRLKAHGPSGSPAQPAAPTAEVPASLGQWALRGTAPGLLYCKSWKLSPVFAASASIEPRSLTRSSCTVKPRAKCAQAGFLNPISPSGEDHADSFGAGVSEHESKVVRR